MAKLKGVRLAGREVPVLVAALTAQEADRRGVLVRDVGDVTVPDPAPTTVAIAGIRISIATGAQIAIAADKRGLHPKKALEVIVQEEVEALKRRARRPDTKRSLTGAWSSGSGGRGGGTREDD